MSTWRKGLEGLVRGNARAVHELRIKTLEVRLDFQFQIILRLIDLVHEGAKRDELRDLSDKELHSFVQRLANSTGVTLRIHRDDIRKLTALVTSKPTDELIDMKATNVWKPK